MLPSAALAPVSAAIGAAGAAYRISASAGGWRARDPAQRLGERFGTEGARDPAPGVQLDAPGVQLGLSVRAAGYGPSLRALGAAAPRVSANRVLYRRGGLDEWYVNGPLGVEQGFTLPQAPAGRHAGPLTIAMKLSGDTRPHLEAGRRSIVLRGAGGASLRYGALLATGAHGRRLRSWLELDGRTILLRVDTSGARYPLRIDPLIQQAALHGGIESEGERFGYNVALSADGDTALVGTRAAAGGVWVFTRSGSEWTQQGQPLKIEEEEDGKEECEETGECGFERSVALSADGNTALIGGPYDHDGRGAAWVFTRSGSTWSQQGVELTGGEQEQGNARFGRSVALSGEGDTALVGASKNDEGRGAVWVFTRSGSTWAQPGYMLTGGEQEMPEGHFGHGVALSADGETALVGAPGDTEYRGAAWVFTRSGATWPQQGAILTGGEEEIGAGRFGSSVALSAFGNTALIGARTDHEGLGAAWVLTRSGSTWTPQGPKLGGEGEAGEGQFGAKVALSADGEVALISAPDDARAGAAWLFTRPGAAWSQQGAKIAGVEGDGFGASVALSSDGTTALIGGPSADASAGAAWVFQNTSVPPPTVASISAESGPSEGGTRVTITGSGFLTGATVEIGGEASSVEVLSETELTAVTPAHAAGSEEVVVKDADGVSAGGPDYTYLEGKPPPAPAPTVASIKPESGSSEGGTRVTITGSGFLTGATVEIGGEASSVEVLSETELTAVTPAHAAGSEEVVVDDADGISTGGPDYTYEEPTITPLTAVSSGTPSGGGNSPAGGGVLSNVVIALPAPQLGLTGNLAPVSGEVLVKLPGSSSFTLLTGLRQVPFGTIINATHGKVRVTTVGPNGRLQVMTYYGGEFELTQGRSGLVVARLLGGNFSVCPTARERSHLARASSTRASGKHVVRKLWSEGHGKYSTKGNYASGAVLGTRWLTEDLCDGTLIHVVTDRVRVTNLVNHRHVTVTAGHSYFAKAP